jgi:hypothetical protein
VACRVDSTSGTSRGTLLSTSAATVRSTEGSLRDPVPRHPLTVAVPGRPGRIVGMYSSSWIRPSKVQLLRGHSCGTVIENNLVGPLIRDPFVCSVGPVALLATSCGRARSAPRAIGFVFADPVTVALHIPRARRWEDGLEVGGVFLVGNGRGRARHAGTILPGWVGTRPPSDHDRRRSRCMVVNALGYGLDSHRGRPGPGTGLRWT